MFRNHNRQQKNKKQINKIKEDFYPNFFVFCFCYCHIKLTDKRKGKIQFNNLPPIYDFNIIACHHP